jgi:opacity protein-like surface antigen
MGPGWSTFSNKFERKLDYGASLAGMGKGAIGFEVDFGYSPNFFETSASSNNFQFTNDSNVTTLTGNLIIGAPVGSIRPYVVGGVGLIRTKLQDVGALLDINTKNDFGIDVGGGLMGFFTSNIGLRGDLRYFRGFRGTDANATGLALGDFKYWRGSLGLSIKFWAAGLSRDLQVRVRPIRSAYSTNLWSPRAPQRPPSGWSTAAFAFSRPTRAA